MASTGKTSAEVLADFVHRTGYDHLPGEAITMAGKMILDQLGDQLASSTLPWNQKVVKYVEDLAIGSDQSTVVGYGAVGRGVCGVRERDLRSWFRA